MQVFSIHASPLLVVTSLVTEVGNNPQPPHWRILPDLNLNFQLQIGRAHV